MRKKIAVFICAISFSNQKRILEGILQEAKAFDLDVFVFTCHVNHSASYMKIGGAFSVMMLPNFSQFDGAVIMKSTIRQSEIADELEEKIRKSNILAVSIEEHLDGMHYVGISDYEAQKKVVDHIIEVHKAEKICYVTGLVDSNSGRERFMAYKDSMKEHGLIYELDDVYFGDYIGESGRKATRKFLEKNIKPDAIVCANDGMALGVINELKKFGFQVPKDVLVTGFDNDTYSRYAVPMLTTIDQNQEEIGREAVRLLNANPADGMLSVEISSKLVRGESCSCKKQDQYTNDQIRENYSKEIGIISQAIDSMKNMSIELTGLTSMEELYERLPKYIVNSDMEAFFLCIEDKDDLGHGEYLRVPLAYVDGEITELPSYPKGNVLPDEMRETEEASFYIVNSLFYSDLSFGYIIQRGSRFALESELAYSWVVNVGIAIENIRKIGLMQSMVDRLNSVWMYDSLTAIYNRAGFYNVSAKLLEDMKHRESKCFLMFFDLDGLKKVNDNLGHEAGDKYITTMAELLKNTVEALKNVAGGQETLAMRYGGDEFVLFGVCESVDTISRVRELLKRELEKINRRESEFSLSFSEGASVIDVDKTDDLSVLIEEADMKMYESKKQKKAAGER